jgi:antitoxin CptB
MQHCGESAATLLSLEIPMTGTTRSSVDLDPRRRKIMFRAWHRGMREMDLIMGRFADAEISIMTDDELDEFERLIEAQDRDLLSWITGEAETPDNYDSALFRRLKAFHHHEKPIHV